MKFFIAAFALVACSLVASDAKAFHFGRRGAAVVNAPGAQVVVGNRGVFGGRQHVVVNAGFAQPVFVQRQFVQPVVVQSFGVQSFHAQPVFVQPFVSGGCQGFFVR